MKALCLALSVLCLAACVDKEAQAFDDLAFEVRGSIYRTDTDKGAPTLLRSLAQARRCEEDYSTHIELYRSCIRNTLPHITLPPPHS